MSSDVFDAIAPELASLSPAVKTTWLGFATPHTPSAVWGSRTSTGRAYLAAHLYTRSAAAGSTSAAPGAPTSLRAGQVAVTYGSGPSVSPGDVDLATTSYGLRFLALRNSLAASKGFVLNLGGA